MAATQNTTIMLSNCFYFMAKHGDKSRELSEEMRKAVG
jgi:hypothetical protein